MKSKNNPNKKKDGFFTSNKMINSKNKNPKQTRKSKSKHEEKIM